MQNPEVQNGLPDIQKEAVEKFGTTNNPYDAGFILSDGRLLRRPRGTAFHNYVEGEGSKPGDFAYKFLDSGAIRFARLRQRDMEIATGEFTRKPTEAQLLALRFAILGVASVSVDFTDIETRRPVVLAGKPVTLKVFHPDFDLIEDFFKRVRKAPNV